MRFSNSLHLLFQIPQRYRFSSKSQRYCVRKAYHEVVLDTTKVQIFKQITTLMSLSYCYPLLFQIPQRYRFSSKSQRNVLQMILLISCFRYHKGTDFQANHNPCNTNILIIQLFQIPQRYRFSSKSQRIVQTKYN